MEKYYQHGCSNVCSHCGTPRYHHGKTPTRSELMSRLLESIAHEELALAHMVNSEAEKVQKVTKCVAGPFMPDEVVALQQSVKDILEKLVQKEELLLKKLRVILAFDRSCDICDKEPIDYDCD